MPSDAKFGLVVGMVLVIAVAVVFFRKDGTAKPPLALERATASLGDNPTAAISDFVNRLLGEGQSTPAKPAPQPPVQAAGARERTHVVVDGDSLFALAERYYGDGDRFHELYKANRDVLKTPDKLPSGAKLRIP